MPNEQTVSIDVVKQLLAEQAKQNAENLAEVIKAVKAPNVIEQKKLDAESKAVQDAQEARKQQSESTLLDIKRKGQSQRICSHEHQKTGQTHGVFVMEKSGPGYVLCQLCQAIVRPGVAPEGYKGVHIYDTGLFNQLFQKTAPSGEIFG